MGLITSILSHPTEKELKWTSPYISCWNQYSMENKLSFLYIKSCRAYLLFTQYLISPQDCATPKRTSVPQHEAAALSTNWVRVQERQSRKSQVLETQQDVTHSLAAAPLTEFPGIPLYFRSDKRKQSSQGIPKHTRDPFLTQHLRRSNFPGVTGAFLGECCLHPRHQQFQIFSNALF